MFLPKSVSIASAVISLVALSACGGAGGPAAVDVVVPQTTEVQTTIDPETGEIIRLEQEEVDEQTVRTRGGLSTSPPPIIDDVAPSLGDVGTVAPVEVDPTDPVLLATLAAIEANQTTIASAALVTNADGSRSVLTRDGLYERIDGSLSLADVAAYLNNDVLGDYDHASAFSQADAVGIVGLATPIADLRTTGDARYEGGASGFVITGTNGVDLIKGRSVVDVAFGVDRVTVTLDNFEGVSQISGLVVDSPVTEIELRNAVIADGGFTGGTLSLRDADGSVNITGSNTTTTAQGQFFGLNADGSTPDEVGGLILSEGTSGIVYGTFIAD